MHVGAWCCTLFPKYSALGAGRCYGRKQGLPHELVREGQDGRVGGPVVRSNGEAALSGSDAWSEGA